VSSCDYHVMGSNKRLARKLFPIDQAELQRSVTHASARGICLVRQQLLLGLYAPQSSLHTPSPYERLISSNSRMRFPHVYQMSYQVAKKTPLAHKRCAAPSGDIAEDSRATRARVLSTAYSLQARSASFDACLLSFYHRISRTYAFRLVCHCEWTLRWPRLQVLLEGHSDDLWCHL
jgi:hypothetical protein